MLCSARASLASAWLDTLLMRKGKQPARSFFAAIIPEAKISKPVLSVFFGQLDACVVTRRGFDTMVELNPQTGRQLEVLAVSDPYVPVAFCFRKDYHSPIKNQILGEIKRWHLSPAGKQSLTIFQTDSLEEQPGNCLKSALDLLEEHENLIDATGTGLSKRSAIDVTRGGKSDPRD